MTNDSTKISPFQVWLIDTERTADPYELATLNCAERDRVHRYKRECDRNSFLRTRAALRQLLADAVGAEPQALQFIENSWGKPMLAGKAANSVSFSVSHTAGLSVVAVSDGRKIGIDMERIRLVPDHDRIALHVFGASVAYSLSRLQAVVRDRAFLQLWTATEAFLKATGTGFSGKPPELPLVFCENSGAVQLAPDCTSRSQLSVSLLSLSLPAGFLGNLIVENGVDDTAVVECIRCN